jgi:hypothetical protein
VQLFQAFRDAGDGRLEETKTGLNDAVEQLQGAAAPLLAARNREQRTAVSSDQVDPRG